jgi:DNA-binding response OmpR family regulator
MARILGVEDNEDLAFGLRTVLDFEGYDVDRGSQAEVRFGPVEVSKSTRTVRRQGELVELTPKEFDLLVALLDRNGAVASRQELLKEVWGYGNPDINTRTVDVHLSELRRKLEEDPSRPVHFLTVRKAGYRLKL